MAIPRPGFRHFIAANEHGFYCVPASYRRREVPAILRRGGVYEPATLAFMQRHAAAGDVVTGGAFVGDFLPALSRALGPGANLITFEPNPVAHEAARCTIALNGLDNVRLYPVAVGESAGTLHLQVARGGGGAPLAAGARIVPEPGDAGETVEVEVVTIDSLVPADRRVSLIHLDVEGHELPALAGARETIARCRPILVLEGGKRRRRREHVAWLQQTFPEAGYVHTSTIEENGIFLPLEGAAP